MNIIKMQLIIFSTAHLRKYSPVFPDSLVKRERNSINDL